jgi:hypothetical protein
MEAAKGDEMEAAALLISNQTASHAEDHKSLRRLVYVIGLPCLKIETWGTLVLWINQHCRDLGHPPSPRPGHPPHLNV